jgi:hypothetical protein
MEILKKIESLGFKAHNAFDCKIGVNSLISVRSLVESKKNGLKLDFVRESIKMKQARWDFSQNPNSTDYENRILTLF